MLLVEIISEKFLGVTNAIKITLTTNNYLIHTKSGKHSFPQIKKFSLYLIQNLIDICLSSDKNLNMWV